jgi:hypothetical protein
VHVKRALGLRFITIQSMYIQPTPDYNFASFNKYAFNIFVVFHVAKPARVALEVANLPKVSMT